MELTKEHFELIPKIDISTPEKIAQFKAWQNYDGSIEGLRKLYESQQSVQADSAYCTCQLFFDDGRSDPAVCEFCGKPQSR